MTDACPCGSGRSYAQCCEPIHDGVVLATTAEQLMRSRYSGFAKGREDALLRTWHPKTRPASVDTSGATWVSLEIIDVVDGQAGDDTGIVEFRAKGQDGSGPFTLHERSNFARRAGRWFYLNGELFESS